MEVPKSEIATIKALLEYQGKLIEEMYQTLNEIQAKRARAMPALPDMTALLGLINSHPATKNSPVISEMIRMFSGMKGGENGS
jgi:flagellar motor component MotA